MSAVNKYVGRRDVPLWLSLGLVIAALAVVAVVPLFGQHAYELIVANEIGFIEIGTVALLLPAVALSGLIAAGRWRQRDTERLVSRRRTIRRRVRLWFVLIGLGALYFAGEEISWGQTYFRWQTPEAFAKHNKQKETNLHNLHLKGPLRYLDDLGNNVPRQGLFLACLFGCIVLPLVMARRTARPESRRRTWYWLIPSLRVMPAALLAVLSTVPEKIYENTIEHTPAEWPLDSYAHMTLIHPSGELKEMAFAMVIFLYTLSVFMRLRSAELPAGQPEESN